MSQEWKLESRPGPALPVQAQPQAKSGKRQSVFLQMLGLGSRIPLKRSVVFCLRLAIRPAATFGWISFLGDFARKESLGRPHDDLLRKSLDVFFVQGGSSRERLRLLSEHFRIASQMLRHDDLEALWQGRCLDMGTIRGRGEDYKLHMLLADHCGSRHEGVFTIRLSRRCDDYSLWTTSFVFVANGRHAPSLAIGGMQGPKGPEAKRALIAATRCLGGLRPKDAMLLVLFGLVSAHRPSHIMAVSNATHVINQRRRKRRLLMRADLDEYWRERGGAPAVPFGFELPVPPAPKDGSGSRRDQSKRKFWEIGARFCRATA